jgi:hypothetical protein
MNTLHSLHDGSQLKLITAKELIKLPVWKGNRIIDHTHVEKLKSSICSEITKLDFGYRIATYTEIDAGNNKILRSYIIDGQHRHQVLKDHFDTIMCEPDFKVVVIEKSFESESDVIEYFNQLNNSKPIQWSDPIMLANRYIAALEAAFNKKKGESLIRPATTKRPYLSVEKLREALLENSEKLKENIVEIAAFVKRVVEFNEAEIKTSDFLILNAKRADIDIIQRALKARFMLAIGQKLRWIGNLL